MLNQKDEELRGKASFKEKADKEKKKIEETHKKIIYSSINLLNKICFQWKNSLVIIMSRQYSKYSKRTVQSTMTTAPQTINRNWRVLWRKEREMMIRRTKLKQISNQKEAILKWHHRSFRDSISVCSVEWNTTYSIMLVEHNMQHQKR